MKFVESLSELELNKDPTSGIKDPESMIKSPESPQTTAGRQEVVDCYPKKDFSI